MGKTIPSFASMTGVHSRHSKIWTRCNHRISRDFISSCLVVGDVFKFGRLCLSLFLLFIVHETCPFAFELPFSASHRLIVIQTDIIKTYLWCSNILLSCTSLGQLRNWCGLSSEIAVMCINFFRWQATNLSWFCFLASLVRAIQFLVVISKARPDLWRHLQCLVTPQASRRTQIIHL